MVYYLEKGQFEVPHDTRPHRLVRAIRAAVEDPLSAEKLQRLWGADYSLKNTAPRHVDRVIEETLGAVVDANADALGQADLDLMLDRFRHAVMVVGLDGRIEGMNLRARRTIAADPGDDVEAIGYELVPPEPLSRAIGRLLGEDLGAAHRIHLLRAVASGTGRTATLAVFRNGPEARTALVCVIDPVWMGRAAAMATRTQGLTPAEADILAAFLDGRSLREIAQDRRSSPATVRKQFHAVMEKFGVTTQAGLVRATLGLAQFMADVEPVAHVARHPHRRRLQILRPGGRSVEVFLAGSPGGSPVIFLPDCTLATFSSAVEARFCEAGLAVASVQRPGCGATDPPPGGGDGLDCMAEDVAAVITQMGGGPAVLAAHGPSAGYAFAAASAIGDLVSRVVVFAGTVPRPHFDTDIVFAPFAAALLRSRDASPHLFRLIVRASGAAWRRLGTRRFNSMNLARSPTDSAISRSPVCIEEFDEALTALLARGLDRLEEDLLLTTSDWSGHVRRCGVPALCLHGIEDPVTHVSSVRRFAQAHDNVSLHELDKAGYLLHLTEMETFVRTLAGPGA